MVLENLSGSLKESLKKIARSVFVDKKLIDEIVRDIQRALLQADVNVKLVFDLSKNIKDRALEEKPKKISPREHLVKIVYEELVKFLGEEKHGIKIDKKPFKIMMIGLFGVGKTTSVVKLARFYSNKGYKVGLLGLDVHRPAAMDQLEQLSKQANIPYFIDRNEKNPLKIYEEYKDELKKFDVVLIDTAGRGALSKDLIEEIEKLNKEIKPDERLLIISADIGQAAQKQAELFHKSCNITGIFITKMDGTAKAGGALSSCSVTKAPIKFIGVGEKLNDLEEFNPKGFVSRLLGMGDIEALLEKAKEVVDEEKAKDMSKKMLKGDFNFIDLYEQMNSLRKMGPLSKIMDLIPGMGNVGIPKEMLDVQDKKLKRWKYIFDSCTKKELENPELLDHNRMERISKGSGIPVGEIRELLKQYRQSKKFLKMMKGGKNMDMEKMMKKFKGKRLKF
jgi:signal recognition particle subunit SRP54